MMKNSVMKIGVLDIQGSVEEHMESLQNLAKSGVIIEPVLVKNVKQLRSVCGLIIPGGESTTIGKLLKRFGLRDEVISLSKKGKIFIWGTCAGAILLAKNLVGGHQTETLGLMDIAIERNAYGRQLDSFETKVKFKTGKKKLIKIPAIFIRAPKIASVGQGVEVLARHNGEIVAARQKNLFVTSFHPELTDSLEVHRYFAGMCQG